MTTNQIFRTFLSTILGVMCISFWACTEDEKNDIIISEQQLSQPSNVHLDTLNRTITWNVVKNASAYNIKKNILDLFPESVPTPTYQLSDNEIDSWQTFYIQAVGAQSGNILYFNSDWTEFTFICLVNKLLLSKPDVNSINYTILSESTTTGNLLIKISWNAIENAGKYSYRLITYTTNTSTYIESGTTSSAELQVTVKKNTDYLFELSSLPATGDTQYVSSEYTVVRLNIAE